MQAQSANHYYDISLVSPDERQSQVKCKVATLYKQHETRVFGGVHLNLQLTTE